MNKVYLAGPFFSDKQRERVSQVVAALKENKTIDSDNIYLPQDNQSKQYEQFSQQWQRAVYLADTRQVHRADVVVAILDYKEDEGNEPDSGTMFEVGMAVEAHIPVILVQFEAGRVINLMLSESLTAFFDESKNGLNELSKYNFNVLEEKITENEVL
ncbi:nucleoside 2-deoxyribosyltransferase [Dellaglioa sp. P0083]|uniref:nucleoside 2-deoxyribosyltransferase n=1 Tax=Dellaglioa kimchii TaxID=3344667 RepID=UPI0038D4C702